MYWILKNSFLRAIVIATVIVAVGYVCMTYEHDAFRYPTNMMGSILMLPGGMPVAVLRAPSTPWRTHQNIHRWSRSADDAAEASLGSWIFYFAVFYFVFRWRAWRVKRESAESERVLKL